MKIVEEIVKRTYADNGDWLPPSEVQPLIRCKDCNNGVIHCENGDIICDHVDSSGNDTHPEDWFCADGERRELWKKDV